MTGFRLLHTSDWHLGALFHDQIRDAEEQLSIDALIDVAKNEQVDVVVIAGDIFDSVNPPAAAQARYYRTLLRLKQEAGVGCMLVIGGNHDHGLRLDGPRDILTLVNAQVRGQFPRDQPPENCIAPITNRQGMLVGWAALVPYLRETDLATVPSGESSEVSAQHQATIYATRLAAIHDALAIQSNGLPMIAVAHAFAAGGSLGSTERPVFGEDVVGRLSRADMSPLANGCSYLALGHLHRPQMVSGQSHWRYSGSLLPMAMDETSAARQVVIAEVPADGSAASTRIVQLPRVRQYARLLGDVLTVNRAIAELTPVAHSEELEGWCDISIDIPTNDPVLIRDLANQVAAKGWRALTIRRQARVRGAPAWSAAGAVTPDLRQLDPLEVFAAALRTQGIEPTAELNEDFAHLVAQVTNPQKGS